MNGDNLKNLKVAMESTKGDYIKSITNIETYIKEYYDDWKNTIEAFIQESYSNFLHKVDPAIQKISNKISYYQNSVETATNIQIDIKQEELKLDDIIYYKL